MRILFLTQRKYLEPFCDVHASVYVVRPAGFAPNPQQQAASEADHQDMMNQLGIVTIRRGADGSPTGQNPANYDESKANPFPNLPDPLVMNNGRRVTTAKQWRTKRRPEIVELFDREIYGRVPKKTPNVTWQVVSTKNEMNGHVPVVKKSLIGHVDNTMDPD